MYIKNLRHLIIRTTSRPCRCLRTRMAFLMAEVLIAGQTIKSPELFGEFAFAKHHLRVILQRLCFGPICTLTQQNRNRTIGGIIIPGKHARKELRENSKLFTKFCKVFEK